MSFPVWLGGIGTVPSWVPVPAAALQSFQKGLPLALGSLLWILCWSFLCWIPKGDPLQISGILSLSWALQPPWFPWDSQLLDSGRLLDAAWVPSPCPAAWKLSLGRKLDSHRAHLIRFLSHRLLLLIAWSPVAAFKPVVSRRCHVRFVGLRQECRVSSLLLFTLSGSQRSFLCFLDLGF